MREEVGGVRDRLPLVEERVGDARVGEGEEVEVVEVEMRDLGGEEEGEMAGLGVGDDGAGDDEGDGAAEGGEADSEAGERQEMTHARAKDDDHMRRRWFGRCHFSDLRQCRRAFLQ